MHKDHILSFMKYAAHHLEVADWVCRMKRHRRVCQFKEMVQSLKKTLDVL